MIEARNLAGLEGLRHGFFTREGGVSEGRFASLNCGFSSDDEPQRVRENRARALQRLGMAPGCLCTARQVHGRAVHLATAPAPAWPEVDADALVTDRPGLVLGVLSADCAPVLIADPRAGVIGAAHAGWRGALEGVIEATVEAMTGLGARIERMRAAVGPCIAQPSYEVGPEMYQRFVAEDAASARLFEAVPDSDRLRFDLEGYALSRLGRAGIADRLALSEDTFADEARFFSARRTRRRGEQRFGLLLSAIGRQAEDAAS